jgi:hypothetical protein
MEVADVVVSETETAQSVKSTMVEIVELTVAELGDVGGGTTYVLY